MWIAIAISVNHNLCHPGMPNPAKQKSPAIMTGGICICKGNCLVELSPVIFDISFIF